MTLLELAPYTAFVGLAMLYVTIRRDKAAETAAKVKAEADLAKWRMGIEKDVERLKEGKDRLWGGLDEIKDRLDAHERGCAKHRTEAAEHRGEVNTKLDALATCLLRIEGRLDKLERKA